MADKTRVTIAILIAVIVVLASIVTYTFVKVKIDGYTTKNQNIGYNIGYQKAFLDIMQTAATCQPIPLTYGNQTITIIAEGCPSQTE